MSEIFEWPLEASTRFVKEAFEDADKGECRIELEAGSQSMRELENATDRLKSEHAAVSGTQQSKH